MFGTGDDKHFVLWIDDDPLVLSTAKRLFRNHNIELITIDNPLGVMDVLAKHNFSVVIADQRMPEKTGIQLLEEIKASFPLITRILLTGFLDHQTIEESVNKANVFRFITKPWNDEELISDINQAVQHHLALVQQDYLRIQVREQNKQLTVLNERLEEIVFERTKSLSESKKEVELRNSQIKNLIFFIQELNKAESIEELLIFFKKEYQSKFNITTLYLLYYSENHKFVLQYFQKNELIEREIDTPVKTRIDIQYGQKEDQEFLARLMGRPVANIIAFPLFKFESENRFTPVIFLEHDLSPTDFTALLDFLTERLQVISLSVDRSLAHRKLRFESQQWEKTFDSMENPIAIIDIDFNILRMNRSFDFFSKVLSVEEQNLIRWSARSGQLQKSNIKKANKIFEVYTYPVKFSGDQHPTNFVNYYVDISEKRELYGKMIQNEKMVALGLLAGNIAHELNNPLTGIRSVSQVLIHEHGKVKKLVEDLQEIDKAALRCQNIISDLLQFSSADEKAEAKPVGLNEIVMKTLPLLKTALRYHNTKTILYQKNILVRIKPHLLQQVIFNLINNACQAMKEPGTVTIRTALKNGTATFSVQDTGPGIDPTIHERIFEAFYTTKPEGEGTGIGLSVCQSIIEKYGGKIAIESVPGKGATFIVMLPVETR